MSITSRGLNYKEKRTEEHQFDLCSPTILPMGRQNRWRVCAVEF